MVNFGLNAAAILGLFLAVAGAGLFFLRSIRPELARDYDIFFAAVGLLCGIILLFNGWRLDPILQFGQFLLTGTAIFFAFESIRMRGVATEQARRNTPTVDRDRPVSRSRVYTEAEVDRIDPYDNVYEGVKPNYSSPRLQGYDDPSPRSNRRSDPRRRTTTTTEVRDEPRRRPTRNRPEPSDYTARRSPDVYPTDERPPERNSRPRPRPTTPPVDSYDDWNPRDEWAETPRTTPRPRPRPRPSRDDSYSEPTPPVTSRRRPSPADLGRSYEPEEDYNEDDLGKSYSSDPSRNYDGDDNNDLGRSYEPEGNEPSIPGDYVVDYQPLDNADDYSDDNYSDDGYDDRSSDYDTDDYDDYQPKADNSDDQYDDYRDRPDNRQPIDFG